MPASSAMLIIRLPRPRSTSSRPRPSTVACLSAVDSAPPKALALRVSSSSARSAPSRSSSPFTLNSGSSVIRISPFDRVFRARHVVHGCLGVRETAPSKPPGVHGLRVPPRRERQSTRQARAGSAPRTHQGKPQAAEAETDHGRPGKQRPLRFRHLKAACGAQGFFSLTVARLMPAFDLCFRVGRRTAKVAHSSSAAILAKPATPPSVDIWATSSSVATFPAPRSPAPTILMMSPADSRPSRSARPVPPDWRHRRRFRVRPARRASGTEAGSRHRAWRRSRRDAGWGGRASLKAPRS
jgi:hypothetical protein